MDSRASQGHAILDGQLDLFSAVSAETNSRLSPAITLPDIPEYSGRDLLRLEKESSGLYFSGHILDEYANHLASIRPDPIAAIKESFRTDEDPEGTLDTQAELPKYADKQCVTLAGMITRRQNKATRSGDQMAFITLEDRTGEMEVIVFPKTLDAVGAYLTLNSAIVVQGNISLREEEDPKLLMQKANPLLDNDNFMTPAAVPVSAAQNEPQPTVQKKPSKLYLKVDSMDGPLCRRVQSFLQIFPGTIPVVFYDLSTGKYMRAENFDAAPTQFVLKELAEILGEDAVVLR